MLCEKLWYHCDVMLPREANLNRGISTRVFSMQRLYSSFASNRPFRLVHFVFPNTDHVIILRRFGLLFCSLKWGHASMNMPACTLFNEQNKGPSLLSIITWSVLGKQNVQAEKVCWSFQVQLSNSFKRCHILKKQRLLHGKRARWSFWNRTRERSERVRFLIQNQRVWKSRTKRFPCCNLFILYKLRFFYLSSFNWFSKIITKLLY